MMLMQTKVRALALALCSLTGVGCGLYDCMQPWSDVETLDLMTSANLLALAYGPSSGQFVAVGAGGVVVHYDDGEVSVSNPTNVNLRGVSTGGATVVVGDSGTILSSPDGGVSWTARTSGIGEDLVGIARGSVAAGQFLVAIAADQVIYSADEGVTWNPVTPAAQGWGGLRAVFASHEQFYVVGFGGSAWATDNPAGAWLREDLGTTDNFIAGGRVNGDEGSTQASGIAVASTTQLHYRDSEAGEWRTLSPNLEGTIAAYGAGFLVTSTGTIYDVNQSGNVAQIANVGLVPLAIAGGTRGFAVAGEGGHAARADFQSCVGASY